jgi:hypothetical protein
LASLPIRKDASSRGFSPVLFTAARETKLGSCAVPERVLQRDLMDIVMQAGSRCVVETGVLRDPYTAHTVAFRRGSRLVVIDEAVSFPNAWVTGAQGWTAQRRERFVQDPLNLLAVSAVAAATRNGTDTAMWLPAIQGFRCAYVARQVAVKARWGLWVSPMEEEVMARTLADCPGQGVPAGRQRAVVDHVPPRRRREGHAEPV